MGGLGDQMGFDMEGDPDDMLAMEEEIMNATKGSKGNNSSGIPQSTIEVTISIGWDEDDKNT